MDLKKLVELGTRNRPFFEALYARKRNMNTTNLAGLRHDIKVATGHEVGMVVFNQTVVGLEVAGCGLIEYGERGSIKRFHWLNNEGKPVSPREVGRLALGLSTVPEPKVVRVRAPQGKVINLILVRAGESPRAIQFNEAQASDALKEALRLIT